MVVFNFFGTNRIFTQKICHSCLRYEWADQLRRMTTKIIVYGATRTELKSINGTPPGKKPSWKMRTGMMATQEITGNVIISAMGVSFLAREA